MVTRRQLLNLGVSASTIDRRISDGTLIPLHKGVYALAGAPPSVLRRRWAALLAAGPVSVLSFDSAARVHGFANVAASGPVVITVPHSGYRRLHGVVVHQLNDVVPSDVQAISDMPITTPARTFVDLAAAWRTIRLARSLDDAVAGRLTSIVDVGVCLKQVARRGKPGVRKLATLLDERGPGSIPAQSVLEAAFFEMLAPSWLPPPERQHELPSLDGRTGFVDAAWPPVRLIVEVDGRRWHQRTADMERDRERDLQAAAMGWMVVRLMYEHIVKRPAETRANLERIYQRRIDDVQRSA